jgi:hypothetical protein
MTAKSDKEETVEQDLNFAQLEGVFFCFGKKGHQSPQCPKKDKIQKSEWVINKTSEAIFIQVASDNQKVATTTPTPPTRTKPFEWMAMTIQLSQFTDNMTSWVLLDTGSTVQYSVMKIWLET